MVVQDNHEFAESVNVHEVLRKVRALSKRGKGGQARARTYLRSQIQRISYIAFRRRIFGLSMLSVPAFVAFIILTSILYLGEEQDWMLIGSITIMVILPLSLAGIGFLWNAKYIQAKVRDLEKRHDDLAVGASDDKKG